MSGRRWTPYELSIILHHYGSLDRFPRADAPLYSPTVQSLMQAGVLDYVEGIPRTTERGFHFVEMLLQTPLPEQVWRDPRDHKDVQRERWETMTEDELLAGIDGLTLSPTKDQDNG